MYKFKLFLKKYQQQIVLVIGYLLVASLAFGLGRYSGNSGKTATNLPSNYSPNVSSTQTTPSVQQVKTDALNCEGKIKGSSSMIYHIPGGAFYEKTTRPIRCFNSEAEASAAGFRKSSR